MLVHGAAPQIQALADEKVAEPSDLEGSGVTGVVSVVQLPHGGANINVVARGLAPGETYVSLYYENHFCELEPYSEDDVIGTYSANAAGVGQTHGKLDDDLDEINSISVRRASDFECSPAPIPTRDRSRFDRCARPSEQDKDKRRRQKAKVRSPPAFAFAFCLLSSSGARSTREHSSNKAISRLLRASVVKIPPQWSRDLRQMSSTSSMSAVGMTPGRSVRGPCRRRPSGMMT